MRIHSLKFGNLSEWEELHTEGYDHQREKSIVPLLRFPLLNSVRWSKNSDTTSLVCSGSEDQHRVTGLGWVYWCDSTSSTTLSIRNRPTRTQLDLTPLPTKWSPVCFIYDPPIPPRVKDGVCNSLKNFFFDDESSILYSPKKDLKESQEVYISIEHVNNNVTTVNKCVGRDSNLHKHNTFIFLIYSWIIDRVSWLIIVEKEKNNLLIY